MRKSEQLNLPGQPRPAEQFNLPLKSNLDYSDFPVEERIALAKSIRRKRAAIDEGKTGVSFTPRELAFIAADAAYFRDDQPTEYDESLLNSNS